MARTKFIGITPIAVGIHVSRVAFYRLGVVRDSSINDALGTVGDATIVIGIAVVRAELDDFVVVGNCLIYLAKMHVGDAAVVVRSSQPCGVPAHLNVLCATLDAT